MARKRFKPPTFAVAAAGLAAGALLGDAKRRAKTRQMVIKVRGAVLPSRAVASTRPDHQDEAHAPGHRHLPPPEPHDPPEGIEHGADTVVSHHPGHVHKG